MFEFILLAQLVLPHEMDNEVILQCAAEVGVEPTTKDFYYTEFKQYMECRRRNNIPEPVFPEQDNV